MWDDTTPRAREIAAWLDAPMDLGEAFGRPRYWRCAVVLAAWLALYRLPTWEFTPAARRNGGG